MYINKLARMMIPIIILYTQLLPGSRKCEQKKHIIYNFYFDVET